MRERNDRAAQHRLAEIRRQAQMDALEFQRSMYLKQYGMIR
jgi:hypothetical protein